ncbi:uncharacterized protein BCN122_II3285 [Burkholderia cenocepacia]|nr:uncharacterized protein BCN122_II3285 [Burkholderia cenocepacia]ESS39404.1 hypothetical protein P355_3874 [Burkholderia cenocepacia KC-01]
MAQCFQDLISAHVGHRQVQKHHGSFAVTIERQGLATIRCIRDVNVPVSRQRLCQKFASEQRIVGNYNRQRHGAMRYTEWSLSR